MRIQKCPGSPVVSSPDLRLGVPGSNPTGGRVLLHSLHRAFHYHTSIIWISLPSSRYDLNNVKRDVNPCPAELIKMPRPLPIFSQSDHLIQIAGINSHT